MWIFFVTLPYQLSFELLCSFFRAIFFFFFERVRASLADQI